MMENLSGAEVNALMRGEYVPRKPAKQPCGDRLVIILPIPPAATHPNARSHWAKKAAAVKKQREAAGIAARHALKGRQPPRWTLAKVQATFYRNSPRCKRSDGDNLVAWMKAGFDGLQDAGIVADDSGLIHLPPIQVLGKDAGSRNMVVLEVTRAD